MAVQHRDGVTTVAVTGDIDLATKDQLDVELARAIGGATATVEVDLSGVAFIDSSGIGVLLKARRQAEAAAVTFRIVTASDLAERILTLAGVWPLLTGGQP